MRLKKCVLNGRCFKEGETKRGVSAGLSEWNRAQNLGTGKSSPYGEGDQRGGTKGGRLEVFLMMVFKLMSNGSHTSGLTIRHFDGEAGEWS